MKSIVKKENTDISGFTVERLPTVNKNVELKDILTRGQLIVKMSQIKIKQVNRKTRRINKLIKEIEE